MAMFKPLSDKFSGMAIKNGDFKCMLINSNHRLSKQHFTIAHELYHLFIQKEFVSEITHAGKFDKSDKNEYAADCFAAYLLMPDDGVISLIPQEELTKNKLTLPTIVKIEQYFACSRRSVLFRLSEMGLIDYNRYMSFTENVKQSAMLLGYDGHLYDKGNDNLIITNYGAKAKMLYDKDIISESHFISLMGDIGIDITNMISNHEQE
jgi:Zn-dependent peptidase ImmA (M78 family)